MTSELSITIRNAESIAQFLVDSIQDVGELNNILRRLVQYQRESGDDGAIHFPTVLSYVKSSLYHKIHDIEQENNRIKVMTISEIEIAEHEYEEDIYRDLDNARFDAVSVEEVKQFIEMKHKVQVLRLECEVVG